MCRIVAITIPTTIPYSHLPFTFKLINNHITYSTIITVAPPTYLIIYLSLVYKTLSPTLTLDLIY